MFSKGSSSWISLATVTPSWVTVGAPNFLSSATLRPLGPSVVLTAPAKISIPFFSERRASSSNTSCFAIVIVPSLQTLKTSLQIPLHRYLAFGRQTTGSPGEMKSSILANNGQNVIFLEHQVLFIIQFELCTAIFGEQDAITFAHIHCCAVTIIQQTATANSDHSPFPGFFFSGIRNNDAALGDFFFSGRFDDYAVTDRTKLCHDVHSFSFQR